MILEPGRFEVGEFRKAIPVKVKLAAALINSITAGTPSSIEAAINIAYAMEFDHRPPLCERPYDTEAGDFIPAQNDPRYIDALDKDYHQERTTGRRPGAEKTVTTRGSDVGERARTKRIKARLETHTAALNAKAGLLVIPAPAKKRPKRKIPSRPFSKGKRKWNSR
jgi:hypothetical protein